MLAKYDIHFLAFQAVKQEQPAAHRAFPRLSALTSTLDTLRSVASIVGKASKWCYWELSVGRLTSFRARQMNHKFLDDALLGLVFSSERVESCGLN